MLQGTALQGNPVLSQVTSGPLTPTNKGSGVSLPSANSAFTSQQITITAQQLQVHHQIIDFNFQHSSLLTSHLGDTVHALTTVLIRTTLSIVMHTWFTGDL